MDKQDYIEGKESKKFDFDKPSKKKALKAL